MKAYKHIQDSKKVVKSLINEAKTLGNVKDRLIELNTLIKLINSFESMLSEKYYTYYFDIIILSKMYDYFLKHINDDNCNENNIPINEFVLYLDRDVRMGRDYKKNDIIDLLRNIQLSQSLKKGSVFRDTEKTWSDVVENTLIDIKKQIKFHKEWKR